MQPFLSPDAAVLSFQNGVDNVDRIYSAIGWRAVPAAVYVAAEMTAPGHVTHTGRGDLVIGHRASWPRQLDLQPLAAMFERAEIPCRISEAIETDLWTKMVMNCAYNAISALTRARYGRMIELRSGAESDAARGRRDRGGGPRRGRSRFPRPIWWTRHFAWVK